MDASDVGDGVPSKGCWSSEDTEFTGIVDRSEIPLGCCSWYRLLLGVLAADVNTPVWSVVSELGESNREEAPSSLDLESAAPAPSAAVCCECSGGDGKVSGFFDARIPTRGDVVCCISVSAVVFDLM